MKWTKREEKCARELFAKTLAVVVKQDPIKTGATFDELLDINKLPWICVARIHLHRVAKLNREILRLKSCLALAEDCIREQDNKLAGMGAKESAIARFTWTQLRSGKKGASK